MFTTFTLCLSLLISAADQEKTADNTPSTSAAKVENSKQDEKTAANKTADTTAEKTEEKQAEKSEPSKENDVKVDSGEKTSSEKKTGKASEEKNDEKDAEKQDEKSDKDAAKNEKDSKASSEKSKKLKKDEGDLLDIEANIISYTNKERARFGLPPLAVDKTLMKTAREHGSWMAWNRIFQHTRRPVAENIAMGQPSSQDVVRSWMNSSGHRANILNPNHRRIGVGAYRTEGGTIYWVQQFSH